MNRRTNLVLFNKKTAADYKTGFPLLNQTITTDPESVLQFIRTTVVS